MSDVASSVCPLLRRSHRTPFPQQYVLTPVPGPAATVWGPLVGDCPMFVRVNNVPTRLVLEVIRDGSGRWDTRTIDLELGRRGARIDCAITADLRQLADRHLIQEDNTEPRGTGPRWHLTNIGAAWLEASSDEAE